MSIFIAGVAFYSNSQVFGIPSATWSFKLAHLHSLSLAVGGSGVQGWGCGNCYRDL